MVLLQGDLDATSFDVGRGVDDREHLLDIVITVAECRVDSAEVGSASASALLAPQSNFEVDATDIVFRFHEFVCEHHTFEFRSSGSNRTGEYVEYEITGAPSECMGRHPIGTRIGAGLTCLHEAELG